jgi:hypothetical protein
MSLLPGTQGYGVLYSGIHVTKPDGTVKTGQPVSSVTQDPMTPVEYGRDCMDSKYQQQGSGGAEIPVPPPPIIPPIP